MLGGMTMAEYEITHNFSNEGTRNEVRINNDGLCLLNFIKVVSIKNSTIKMKVKSLYQFDSM